MTTTASMTYDSLVADILSYCERVNDVKFAAQVPRFIMMAENRIASEVRGLGLMKVVSNTMTLGNPVLAKPERWRETASFRAKVNGKNKTLFLRSYEYCSYYAPDPTSQGEPRFYADYGYEHFFLAPSPDQAYAFELMYYERPQPLSSSHETSWTTRYAPQLLLYASLLEAAPWLKTDDRIAVWKDMYMQASTAVTRESLGRAVDMSAAGSQ